jgi:hypothetical protein
MDKHVAKQIDDCINSGAVLRWCMYIDMCAASVYSCMSIYNMWCASPLGWRCALCMHVV